MDKDDLKNTCWWIGVIALFVILLGGIFYGMYSSFKTETEVQNNAKILIGKQYQIENATINSPNVIIRLDTPDAFLAKAKQINTTVVYYSGSSFTIITSDWTVGYSYQPKGEYHFWWIWG